MNPTMDIEDTFRYNYLQQVYEDTLDDWKEDATTENTLSLGWAIAELEGALRSIDRVDQPIYPNTYFHHLLTMDGQTLRALPAQMVETTISLDASMLRHYALTRPHPVVIFKEVASEGGSRSVAYLGNKS